MYQCPICKKENTGLVCASCGFDASRDYESNPTLAELSGSFPARSTLVEGLLQCANCGGFSFRVNPGSGL